MILNTWFHQYELWSICMIKLLSWCWTVCKFSLLKWIWVQQKSSHITLAWLKCWTQQSNQTLKGLEFDVHFFSTKEAGTSDLGLRIRWFTLPQKILLPIQRVSGHFLLALSYRGKVVQVKALKSKHEHNGPEPQMPLYHLSCWCWNSPESMRGFP